MVEIIAERRKNRRFKLSADLDLTVEFNFPNPHGNNLKLPLTDISASGFSFAVNDDMQDVETGMNIVGAVLRFGDCAIHGDLMVMHFTEGTSTCGCLFFPASDDDLIKMRTLITGIMIGQRS